MGGYEPPLWHRPDSLQLEDHLGGGAMEETASNSSLVSSLVTLAIYVLPTGVAFFRHSTKRWPIAGLNLLLGWTIVAWLGALLWAIFSPDRRKEEAKREAARSAFIESAYQKLVQAVEPHKDTLALKRAQLIYSDAYGNAKTERWLKEASYFWERNVLPQISVAEDQVIRGELHPAQVIEQSLSVLGVDVASMRPRFAGKDPLEFERYCAELLKEVGWEARTTAATNDQGADVVATKNGLKIVLQCKLYSNAVGNAAVQEVVASRSHERADEAAVVTNSTYTRAAQELASSNHIALLHYNELQRWAEGVAAETVN